MHACGFALLLAIAHSTCADTITLKSAARQRADSNGAVTLGDIAVLEGEDALALSHISITTVKSGGKPVEISVAEVRRALDAAGANWARINLSGRSVLVRPARDGGSLPPQAMAGPVAIDAAHAQQPATHNDNDKQTLALDAIVSEQTVRGAIATLIVSNLRIDSKAMRVHVNADDLTLLNTPLSSGRFEIQPLGSLAGDRLAFTVRSWSGAQSQQAGQIGMTVERLVSVTRAHRDMPRDLALNEDDLETASQWLSPTEALQVAPRASIVGRTVTRSLKQGDVIRARDVQRETLVKRGDMAIIRCLVGGVAISLQAEARAEGGAGDTIEFRKTGERETFLATITGKNEAVVDLSKK